VGFTPIAGKNGLSSCPDPFDDRLWASSVALVRARSGHGITDSAPEKTWFRHPRGLTFLFGTEMWEQFS
jgi:hypothetical protein